MREGRFRKRVPLLILFVFFIFIGAIAFVLSLRYGIIRDEYYSFPHPEPFYVKYGLVLCLALSLLSVFLCLCLYRKLETSSKLKRFFMICGTILIVLCALTEYLCWDYQNKVIEQGRQSFIQMSLVSPEKPKETILSTGSSPFSL